MVSKTRQEVILLLILFSKRTTPVDIASAGVVLLEKALDIKKKKRFYAKYLALGLPVFVDGYFVHEFCRATFPILQRVPGCVLVYAVGTRL